MISVLRACFFTLIVISFFSAGFSQTKMFPANQWQAAWIADSKVAVSDDSLLYQDNPAPLFRKEFLVSGPLKKATLYITGIGYYEASINGVKLGDQYLSPGWTDYRKTVPYNVFDVTARLRDGRSCLGVELGNGWYDPLPLLMWGGLNIRKFVATGKPRLMARLEIEYKDGHHQIEVSDGSWKATDGPLRRNNNYIGSTYDDNYVLRGWNMPGVSEGEWRKVMVVESPGGELVAQQHPPVRVREVLRPLGVRNFGPGKWLVDMGRNFGGIVRLRAKGRKGSHIVLRYGELLHPDGSLNVMTSVAGQVKRPGMGGTGAPPVAWQQDDLILGDREVVFEPKFTFHGFRYVEIDGYPGVLTPDRIQGIVLASDVPSAGNFRCSDELFNRIQDATRHTFLSNLFSVQSDCPHREKLGYGGDIVATSEAFMANFGMHDFYAKTVRDFADDAMDDGGLTETAPYVGISDEAVTRGSGPIGWGTVLPLLLRQLYQYYGDTGLIRTYYPVAKRWVDFLHAHADHYIINKGIGDHESVDPKQVEVTSTAFLYYNTHLLAELAGVLGLGDDEARYMSLAEAVRGAFVKKFYDPSTGAVGIHTEGTQAFALYFHLLPAAEEAKVLKVLLDQVNKGAVHVRTGIFGTKYLLEVLSEHGLSDLACRLVMQKDFPGWGNMLDHGATTLWEHWEFSDDTYSHNHPMFGSVSGWFYKYIAGIQPAPDAVGYDKLILEPSGFERLSFAQASYRSAHGVIRAAWKRKGDSLYYEVTVPAGVTGTVLLPGKIAMVGAGQYKYSVKLAGVATGAAAAGTETLANRPVGVIPYPVAASTTGGTFVIDGRTEIVRDARGKLFEEEAGFMRKMLRGFFGSSTGEQRSPSPAGKGSVRTIILKEEPSIKEEEGYRLNINTGQIVLSASHGAGMFYAVETLRQLLPAELEDGHGVSLPVTGVDISDHPKYAWRGMHLDVSRHFFSTDYLRKYIDMMALYKMNKLHLHLTDDQGWRIEIRKYPRLAKEGSWRTFNNQDSACMRMAKEMGNPDMNIDPKHIRTVNGQTQYGGYYTQEEMKSVIQYAAGRHIEIIPEIDMPGHMMAAIALYPELTCDGKAGDDWTRGFSTPVCPCRENVLDFAKDIFTEIAALFPSRYIHIGGDEVERSHWGSSPVCQEFMKEHHIQSLPQLQSYFNDYMQAFFRSKGKVLMGWDEIVEGGIDSTAAVMFWRAWARTMPAKATANGNKVVMASDGPLYFDAIPDKNSLSQVYHYSPVDAAYGMDARQQKNILGVHACLWTEMVPTEDRADYLVMPRLSALAELGWTNRDLYDSYLQRLAGQYDRLDRMHIHYRLPDLPGAMDSRVFVDTASFMVQPPMKGMTIHYTTDGSWPVMQSPVLETPLRMDRSLTLRIAAFTATGRRGDVHSTVFRQEDYAKPVAGGLEAGLQCKVYQGDYSKTADMEGAPARELVMSRPELLKETPSSGWGMRFTGYINVPETGVYSFYLNSDDGSVLRIAGRVVVDNDGLHSAREKAGQVALEKGPHIFSLDFIDGGGGSALDLRYSIHDGAVQELPVEWFRHGGEINTSMIRKVDDHPRIVNIVNFIRWLEPRDSAITKDVLYQTVVKQIDLMKRCRLGGSFLLQYDALTDPRYQRLLRSLSRDSFEIGAWWELPQQLVEKAGLKWRGRYSWDWRADVGFAAGYSVEDRRKMVDVYMEDFKQIFGYYPSSVGSWYIDAYTLDYMYTRYGIKASCNCKDQVGTDGYTLWGGYWNQAYYPSKLSAYMPAQHIGHQIPVPVFRMLGSDPIRQYENGLGQERQGVVTLEPVYEHAGGDSSWVQWFLKELVEGPCMEYGYTQAGQENSFTWAAMGKGLEMQFPLIARLRDEGKLKVETLKASGEWFRQHYAVTPATSVTVKEDLPGRDKKTVWFDSRWYRANFIWDKGTMRCRDLHLFDEGKVGDIPQANPSTVSVMSTLPFVDGYIWSGKDRLAGMRLMTKEGGQEVELKGGDPVVTDSVAGKLFIRWPLTSYKALLLVELSEDRLRLSIEGAGPSDWWLDLVCSGSAKLPFKKISGHRIDGVYEGRAFSVGVLKGQAAKAGDAAAIATGAAVWTIHPGAEGVELRLGK
jgi:hexosaminidase